MKMAADRCVAAQWICMPSASLSDIQLAQQDPDTQQLPFSWGALQQARNAKLLTTKC